MPRKAREAQTEMRRIRDELDMSLQAMGELTGYSGSYLSRLEVLPNPPEEALTKYRALRGKAGMQHLEQRTEPAVRAFLKRLNDIPFHEENAPAPDADEGLDVTRFRALSKTDEIMEYAVRLVSDAHSASLFHPHLLITSQSERSLFSPFLADKDDDNKEYIGLSALPARQRWQAVLKQALAGGLEVVHLLRLRTDASLLLDMVLAMWPLLFPSPEGEAGQYRPMYFYRDREPIIPPYDLLIAPTGALVLWASTQDATTDAALFYPSVSEDTENQQAIRIFTDHFSRMRERCAPLVHAQSNYNSWEELTRVEQRGGAISLFSEQVTNNIIPMKVMEERARYYGECSDARDKEDRYSSIVENQQKRRESFRYQVQTYPNTYLYLQDAIHLMAAGDFDDGLADALGANHIPKAQRKPTPKQCIDVLNALIDLLREEHSQFRLGLLESYEKYGLDEIGYCKSSTVRWLIGGTHTLYMEIPGNREKHYLYIEINEPTIIRSFQNFFNDLWDTIQAKGKPEEHRVEDVIAWLEQQRARIAL